MSNETKRDVFARLAEDLKINDSFDEEYPKSQEDIEKEYKENIHNYDAALPDDLPVIPEVVGKYVTWCKGEGGISNILDAVLNAPGNVENWIYNESNWSNSNVLAHAWVIGAWKVEETGKIIQLEKKENDTKD
mgnify:CR=1 FL=1